MATSKLQFLLQLQDKLSGPVGAASGALRRLEGTLTRVGGAVRGFASGFTSRLSSLRDGAGTIRDVGTGFLALNAAAVGAVGVVARLGVALGGVVLQAAAFREQNIGSMAIQLGGGAEGMRRATNLFQQGLRLAVATPFDSEQVLGAQRTLLSQGFSEQELNPMMAFVSDLTTRSGDPALMGRLIEQLGQVRSLGALQWQDLRQIAVPAGLNVGSVMERIGAMRGVNGSPEQVRASVQRMMAARQIDANTGIRAMMDVLMSSQGGQALGTQTEAGSRTLGGLWNSMRDLPSLMLNSIAFENVPGIQRIKDAMQGVIDLFTGQNTTRAERFQRIVSRLVDSVATGLFSGLDSNGIGSFADRLLDIFEQLSPIVRDTFLGLRSFGEGFWNAIQPALAALGGGGDTNIVARMGDLGTEVGTVAVAVGGLLVVLERLLSLLIRLGEVIGTSLARLTEVGESLGDQLFNMLNPGSVTPRTNARGVGEQVAAGLAEGMNAGAPTVAAAGARLATVADESTRVGLQVRSPSRVFEEIGRYTAEGFSLGIDRNVGVARGSLASMTQAPNTTARTGNGAPITVTIIVDGARDPSAVADEAFQRFSEVQQLAQPEMS